MCGICGILQPDADRAARDERVERMTGALVHRGPDDSGAWSDDRISLGFRRLAVIDLETGNQPIRLEDDRAVIVLNGEIYNFRELRHELEPRHEFRTRGDVEVVLRLYAEEGIDCLRRLNGMFALAIWDGAARTLHLARDRFGIKPLFVCEEGGAIAFGSELRTLLAGGFPADRALDPLELRHFLYQKYTSPSGAILRGVEAVPPGTVLSIGPRGKTLHRFWEPPEPTVPAPADLRQELEERLQVSARRQLVADVPVGVFLSGGLDSSTLAALVRRVEAGPVRTFSVGFEGPDAVNELPAAREVARVLGTEHNELTMDPDAVAWDLAEILGDLDGPLGDATCIPTWYMSRLAREGVTVALSGEGADEVFGGYERQRYDVWIDGIGRWGRALAPLAMRLTGRRPSARFARRLGMPTGLTRWLDWSKIFSADEVDALAVIDLPAERDVVALHEEMAARWRERDGRDPLNARLQADRELFLPGDLLPKVDRMSMAHSLEVRVPYLDNDLVDWVLPLPGRLKANRRQGKLLLRAVAASVLPEAARRPKQGFDVPVAAWLRGPLREPMTDLLSEETVRRRGLFRSETVSRMVGEHLDGKADHGEPLWLLMALEGWQQRALDGAATKP